MLWYLDYYMVRDILEVLEQEISDWLIAAGVADPVVSFARSATPTFGEFATAVALRYAKELNQTPMLIAQDLAADLNEKRVVGITKVEAVHPGFVNIFLSVSTKVSQIERITTEGDRFGKNALHAGEKWVIEHTSPNPNKAMHLGHLRNNLIGMSLTHLLENAGATVTADAIYNNRGIAMAKVMYGYLAHMKKNEEAPIDITYWAQHQSEWYTPREKEEKPDLFVSRCYALAENDIAEDPAVDGAVRQLVIDWEANDAATWKLWSLILSYAYEGIEKTLDRLGSRWDKVWYEHEHYQAGKAYVTAGLEKGIFSKLADGAVLTNLEAEYNLPETVLLKRDGTSLYVTQDIALTDLKKKRYDADRLVWIVGPDQKLAMQQLFAVCEQLGIGKRSDFTHIGYGYVGLKDAGGKYQKMSSRAGTAVLIDDVLDDVKASISERLETGNRKGDSELAEQLAVSAVKFDFLKSDAKQDVTFSVTQAIDIHGDSGMYVLYAYVRTQSILRKAGLKGQVVLVPPEALGTEADVLRILLYFEDATEQATRELSVHHVTQYLLELSSEFNSWYAKETILDGTEREAYRLAVVQAVATVLANGLALLGIDTVEQM